MRTSSQVFTKQRGLLGLTFRMAQRDVKLRFAGAHLGVLWSVVIPLINAVVYVLIFSFIFDSQQIQREYNNAPYILFYFPAMAAWSLFAEIVTRTTNVVVENAKVVANIRFPLIILPASVVMTSLVAHGVFVAITIVLAILFGVGLTWHVMLLPFAILLLAGFALGIGYVLAALTPYLRDLVQVVPIVLNVWFFATPIAYPPSFGENAPIWLRIVFIDANPMHYMVEMYRWVLIGAGYHVGFSSLVLVATISLVAFCCGISVYRRFQPFFADVL